MYRGDTSTKMIHQIRDVSPPIWSFFRYMHAWTSQNSSARTPAQWIISIRRTIWSVFVDISPHAPLVEAHECRKWVLLSALSGDTSFVTIHQKLDVSGRYISDTLRLRLVRGGSSIHQKIDVSSRYIKHQTIHLIPRKSHASISKKVNVIKGEHADFYMKMALKTRTRLVMFVTPG